MVTVVEVVVVVVVDAAFTSSTTAGAGGAGGLVGNLGPREPGAQRNPAVGQARCGWKDWQLHGTFPDSNITHCLLRNTIDASESAFLNAKQGGHGG